MTDTDIKTLVERLRNEARFIFDQPEGERAMREAADALEACQAENAAKNDLNLDLEFELAEARGRRDNLEETLRASEQEHQDFRWQNDREWKAKIDHQKARAEKAEAALNARVVTGQSG